MVKSIINVRRSSNTTGVVPEGTVTDVRKPEIMNLTSLQMKLFADYSDHPRLVTLSPKLKSTGAGRYSFFPLWDAYRNESLTQDFSPKSQDAAFYRIKERGALPYDWSWWYPSGHWPCSNIWKTDLPGAQIALVSSSMGGSLIAKFKEAGGTVREIDVWSGSHPRLSPLWLSASSSACHGRNHYRMLYYLQSPARQKCWRTEAGERGNLLTLQMRRRDVCCARCKIRES